MILIEKKQIASTVKLFIRDFYFKGDVVRTGGIGEVSTKVEYRSQGLAKNLLNMAVGVMKEKKIPVSTLISSKAAPYYAQMGWVCVPTFVSKQTVPLSLLLESDTSSIKRVDFSSKQELQQVNQIYNNFSQKFNGVICRLNFEYWTVWVRNESPFSFVFVQKRKREEGEEVKGYASVVMQGGQYLRVREFVLAEDMCEKEHRKEVLKTMIAYSIKEVMKMQDSNLSSEITILHPSPILEGKFFDNYGLEVEKINSMMYRVVEEDWGNSRTFAEDLCGGQMDHVDYGQCKHLFWETDKF